MTKFTDYCTSSLAADIKQACSDPIVAGFKKVGIIMNEADIESITKDATRGNVINGISLAQGKKAYYVYSNAQQSFNGTKTTFEAGNASNGWVSDVSFVILNNDPDVTGDIIDQLTNGKFCMILEAEYTNDSKVSTPYDSCFRAYGFQRGLKMSAAENDPWSADTDGGWSITLHEDKSPISSMWFYVEGDQTGTAYDATKRAVEDLTTQVQ